MNSLPEKVFTAQGAGARAPMPEALTPFQNEDLPLIKNEAQTPFQNEDLTLVKNEALAEAGSSCQVCGEPGPVFECPACNSNLCCECYDMCQLAHWGDSDTRREQLAGISK